MIKDMKKDDRPREKILREGVQLLNDTELIQAVIGSGTSQAGVGKISKQVSALLRRNGFDISYTNLKRINGLGPARISQILATLELGRRHVKEQTRPQSWYEMSKIDYTPLFINAYIAYNVWYVKTTGQSIDSDAIAKLKKRYTPWDEYEKGMIMPELLSLMQDIIAEGKPYVHIKSPYDWRALMDFWYYVRCQVFHGVWLYEGSNTRMIQLAYESLLIFMNEVMRRDRVQE